MSRLRRVSVASGFIVLGASLAVGVTLLHEQGLDRAAEWATVIGFFFSSALGVAGVGMGWLAVRQADRPSTTSSPTGQVVDDVVSGGVDQIREVTGSVRYGTSPRVAAGSSTATPADPQSPSAQTGGQRVTHARIDGVIRQVRRVGGDVEIN
jgi:hypothetical protein